MKLDTCTVHWPVLPVYAQLFGAADAKALHERFAEASKCILRAQMHSSGRREREPVNPEG